VLIVIEGLDRTGKSTLAKNLQALAAPNNVTTVNHHSKPKSHPLDEYEADLDWYLPGTGFTVIEDRFHIGERVWPTVFGRKSEMDEAMFLHIELFLRSRGALTIYADRDLELLKNELQDEPIDIVGAREARQLFDSAMFDAVTDVVGYDYTRDSNDLQDFVTLARMHEAEAAHIAHVTYGEYIGNPHPSVLLVGDRFGPAQNGRRWARVPFVPYPNTSGHFLMSQLLELGNIVRDIGIINAYAPSPYGKLVTTNFDRLLRRLGKPKVIALGKDAAKALTSQDIEHNEVPHPQFWRRFKRAAGSTAYADLLEEVAA
jgi:hypothetical protein